MPREVKPEPGGASHAFVRMDTRVDDARGRRADTPSEVPAAGWKDILWRTWEGFQEDRILLVAAGVTFYALLALVPALASFLSLYGLFFDPQSVAGQIDSLSGLVPGGALDIIGGEASRIASQGKGTLSLTFLFTLAFSLWSANAGVKSIFDALNVAYDEEEKRSFLQLNLQSLAVTLGAIVLLIVALAALAVVPVLLNTVGLGPLAGWLIWLGRWPVLVLAVLGALAVLYRFGPSREKPQWRWVTWGSAVATAGWVVFSVLFSWYVANFGNYNATYGSLGAVIGFMTWLWLSATIVLVGAELNAELEHQTTKDTTDGGSKPMGERGARMADTVGEAKG